MIECFSEDEGHRIEMSASNSTSGVQLMGLIPSTPYNCCVSALPALHELYVYKRTCTDEVIMIQMTEHTQRAPDLIDMFIIIAGVLGFIIAILLLLLVVAILCLGKLIRSKFPKTTKGMS